MNKKEERRIRRKFCYSCLPNYTFESLEIATRFLEKRKQHFPGDNIILCSNCGCYHLLHQYYQNMDDDRQYPNLTEREVLLNQLPLKEDYSRKRTKRKMIGRYRHIQRFPKPKRMFGTVPDNGWFDRIVSARFICFTCHKSWRKFNRKADQRRLSLNRHNDKQICPHCGNELQQVYPMFRAPKRNDIKAWEKLEARYRKKV